jgi:5-oxoprolinase (ATP-hydrolysing) subunit A
MFKVAHVFLNIDAGETDDEPDELYALAHAVSIACGGHAGDERSMERVLRACAKAGTRAGAHPSYEDREGFGRREVAVAPAALQESVRSQCATLASIAGACGVTLSHVKAHGALYHSANRDPALARAVIAGARAALGSPLVLGPAEGELRQAAEAVGLRFAREGFADRATRPDGSLVPRSEPGAVIADPVAARAQAKALAASGAFDTLCVHGDTKNALAIARGVREELDAGPTTGDR